MKLKKVLISFGMISLLFACTTIKDDSSKVTSSPDSNAEVSNPSSSENTSSLEIESSNSSDEKESSKESSLESSSSMEESSSEASSEEESSSSKEESSSETSSEEESSSSKEEISSETSSEEESSSLEVSSSQESVSETSSSEEISSSNSSSETSSSESISSSSSETSSEEVIVTVPSSMYGTFVGEIYNEEFGSSEFLGSHIFTLVIDEQGISVNGVSATITDVQELESIFITVDGVNIQIWDNDGQWTELSINEENDVFNATLTLDKGSSKNQIASKFLGTFVGDIYDDNGSYSFLGSTTMTLVIEEYDIKINNYSVTSYEYDESSEEFKIVINEITMYIGDNNYDWLDLYIVEENYSFYVNNAYKQ